MMVQLTNIGYGQLISSNYSLRTSRSLSHFGQLTSASDPIRNFLAFAIQLSSSKSQPSRIKSTALVQIPLQAEL